MSGLRSEGQQLGPEWLKLRLISGDSVTVARHEVLAALRHRLSLFYFAAVICAMILMDLHGADRNMMFWQDAIFYVTLKIGSILIVVLGLTVLRLRSRTAAILQVHMSALTLIVAAGMVAASEVAVVYRGGEGLEDPALMLAFFILYWAITETETLLYCTWVVPHILRDLRARTPVAPGPSVPASAPVQPIQIGDLLIDPATVCHVRAEGNYVDIRTDTDRHYLLATFSTVVAGLERQNGQQIHRSHWIAARVLRGFYRDGRDIIVRLEDGTEVAVAQSRQKDLLPWLQSVTVRL